MKDQQSVSYYRTIWISDLHLGTENSKSEMLLEFLRSTDSKYLFLVGDIIDAWRMKKKIYWHQTHNDIIQKILRKARKGTKVIFIPGNHDELVKNYSSFSLGNISIKNKFTHKLADGRNALVLHGDEFDAVILNAKWLASIGSSLYEFILKLNNYLNFVRRKLGLSYWSLSQFLKHQTKRATNFISNFEFAVSDSAKRANADVVVCGHIHKPVIKKLNGVLYCNDGDWVESCSALVENKEGQLSLIDWSIEREKIFQHKNNKLAESVSV